MATLKVSIPQSTKNWIEEQVEKGTYVSVDDYLRSVVRRDQQRDPAYQMTLEELQQMLDDSVAGGVSKKTLPDLFEEARQLVEKRRTNLG